MYVLKDLVIRKPRKIHDHCHYTGRYWGAAYRICNLRYKPPKDIPVIIYNSSKYDYYPIIKGLAKKFKGEFQCLGENTEKYLTFLVPIDNDNGD